MKSAARTFKLVEGLIDPQTEDTSLQLTVHLNRGFLEVGVTVGSKPRLRSHAHANSCVQKLEATGGGDGGYEWQFTSGGYECGGLRLRLRVTVLRDCDRPWTAWT